VQLPSHPLSTVYWICTQACNLRCTYCYQDASVARDRELSTAEGYDLVDQAIEAGARTFVFTGGEPFHRRDQKSRRRRLRLFVSPLCKLILITLVEAYRPEPLKQLFYSRY
jgi:MoaA/NifB/PqqE/SkfB family radical SAM enzyme